MYLNIIENIIILGVLLSALFVLISNNPIQSLLYIMLNFVLSSIIFLILGAEFMSLLIFIVYIGAIAVLFLFVIMMLNVKIVELRSMYLKYISIGIFIILFFFFELFFLIYLEFIFIDYRYSYIDWILLYNYKGNIYILGSILYTNFFFIFLNLGLILFIAMFGSIVLLANWNEKNVKMYNNIYYYNNDSFIRSYESIVFINDINPSEVWKWKGYENIPNLEEYLKEF